MLGKIQALWCLENLVVSFQSTGRQRFATLQRQPKWNRRWVDMKPKNLDSRNMVIVSTCAVYSPKANHVSGQSWFIWWLAWIPKPARQKQASFDGMRLGGLCILVVARSYEFLALTLNSLMRTVSKLGKAPDSGCLLMLPSSLLRWSILFIGQVDHDARGDDSLQRVQILLCGWAEGLGILQKIGYN